MAGNIVKWWKHKILGGYKQFSVQECTTDSEELMYHQVRASSSCSAPPDLLMVSDRENNIPLRTPVVNIITTATTTPATAHPSSAAVGSSGVQKHHQHHAAAQQQTHKEQQQHQQHSSKDGGKHHLKLSSKNKIANTQQQLAVSSQQQQQPQSQPHLHHAQQQQDEIDGQQQSTTHQRHSSSHHQGKEERIRLEEFTCDVSVEGGKSTQPLQFSFTFYDLDGHHGKITKDDIVGIVYTIYESIGKSVVVPHCGSKTINVRLTVSPEGKSKSAAAAATSAHPAGGGGGKLKTKSNTGATQLESGKAAGHGHGHTRRQHRYRPRKLIKSDDEDDDSNSDKEKEMAAIMATAAAGATTITSGGALIASNMSAAVPPAAVTSSKSKSHSSGIKYNKLKSSTKMGAEAVSVPVAASTTEQQQVWYQEQAKQQEVGNATELQQQTQSLHIDAPSAVAAYENLYENMPTPNVKCCTKETILKIDDCRSCEAGVVSAPIASTGYVRSPTDVYMRQASTRVKMLRKARKQKFQEHCNETRQRSLSVGNEACWYNRHVQQQQQHKQGKLEQPTNQQQPQQQLGDVVDGVQLRNPRRNPSNNSTAAIWTQRQRNSAECWKTALNRNELMSIIRESMEKNRLCFQMSGKPQANVSPIRQPQHPLQQPHSQQRQRSNTISKIPTLIANHSNAVISPNSSSNNNNNNNNNNPHNTNGSNNNHHHHHHQHQHNHRHSHSHNNSKSNSNSSSHSHSSNHTNNNSSELNLHDISTTNTQYHPPQPHIPIYHQQMAINPAVLAAQSGIQHAHHSKMNLCGYDSFLHATICGGSGANHSPPPVGVNTLASPQHMQNVGVNGVTNQQQQQLIATVQPIMTVVPSSNSTPAKVFLNSTTHQIKTSKILRSGSYSQQHAHAHVQSLTTHNSPQYHGYQRLSSSSAHHGHHSQHNQQQQQQHIQQLYQQCSNKLAALNLASTQLERPPGADHMEKWLKTNKNKQQRKECAKYMDNNLLYTKLSEKLQETSLKVQHQSRSENGQRRKHKSAHKVRAHSAAQNVATAPKQQGEQQQPASDIHSSSSNTSIGNCIMLIPMHGDPAECENLIAPTTTDDDDAVSEAPIADLYTARKAAESTSKTASENATCTAANVSADATTNDKAEDNNENNVVTADLLDLSDDAELLAVEAVESDVTLRASDTGELDEMNNVERIANEDDAGVDEEEDGDAEPNGGCVSLANTSGGSASLIHRYVHEHIHHHYHHFEEKDDKI